MYPLPRIPLRVPTDNNNSSRPHPQDCPAHRRYVHEHARRAIRTSSTWYGAGRITALPMSLCMWTRGTRQKNWTTRRSRPRAESSVAVVLFKFEHSIAFCIPCSVPRVRTPSCGHVSKPDNPVYSVPLSFLASRCTARRTRPVQL